MIDLIIPVFNEEQQIKKHQDYYRHLGRHYSLIFVDGGSEDKTVKYAASVGKVVVSPKGRSIQKNYGAQVSQQKYLLFLHADTLIDDKMIDQAIALLEQGADAGCFQMMIQDRRIIFRFFEWLVNMRAKVWGIMDGDLGLFIRREVFDNIGGFPEVAIMEDILIGRNLKDIASVQVLPQRLKVSARKWHEQGFWKLFRIYVRNYWDLYWTGKVFTG